MRLDRARRFPFVGEAADDGVGDDGGAGAVLGEDLRFRTVEGVDRDVGLVVEHEAEHLGAQLAGQVGGVPHEGLAAAQVDPRGLVNRLDDATLRVLGVDAEFATQPVE